MLWALKNRHLITIISFQAVLIELLLSNELCGLLLAAVPLFSLALILPLSLRQSHGKFSFLVVFPFRERKQSSGCRITQSPLHRVFWLGCSYLRDWDANFRAAILLPLYAPESVQLPLFLTKEAEWLAGSQQFFPSPYNLLLTVSGLLNLLCYWRWLTWSISELLWSKNFSLATKA